MASRRSEADVAETEHIPRTIGGFLRFTFRQIVIRRRWALLPLWVLLAAVAILLVLSGNTHLLPVIYLAF